MHVPIIGGPRHGQTVEIPDDFHCRRQGISLYDSGEKYRGGIDISNIQFNDNVTHYRFVYFGRDTCQPFAVSPDVSHTEAAQMLISAFDHGVAMRRIASG